MIRWEEQRDLPAGVAAILAGVPPRTDAEWKDALRYTDRFQLTFALVKDVGCTACAAGVSVFFPDDELAPRADMMLMDITRPADVLLSAEDAFPEAPS